MTDYSAHLIAARKALATAEAHAALRHWHKAATYFRDASWEADLAAEHVHDLWQAEETALDTPPQSGADK